MKFRDFAFLTVGVVGGILIASKKDSKTYVTLKEKANNAYLEIKELDMDDIKDKYDDIKIEISKLDATRSKEIISEQSLKIKSGLIGILDDLQKNKKIKPALENAVDSTEKAIIDMIDYIDDNDLVDKTKEQAQKAYSKTVEYVDGAREKASDFAEDAKGKMSEFAEEAKEKTSDFVEETKEKASDLKEKTTSKIKKRKVESEDLD